MSISMFLKSLALDFLRQIRADLNKVKDVFALIKEIVLTSSSAFSSPYVVQGTR